MLELYHNDMSTCAQKVRLVLAEKGLEWKNHHLNLRKGESRTKDYIKNFNPSGVVPTLVDGGVVIYESTVIMEYLDDKFPVPSLRPADPVARARMRLWTKRLDEGLHADTGNISVSIAFRYQIIGNRTKDELEAHINSSPVATRRERQRDVIYNGIESDRFPTSIMNFEKLFDDMEAALTNAPWLAGETYSLADSAYTPYLTRYEHLQLLGVLDKRPKVADWYERIKARPSYDLAMCKWFNPTYLPLMEEKGNEAWPRVKEIIAAA
jgi:glutathione S-transferase